MSMRVNGRPGARTVLVAQLTAFWGPEEGGRRTWLYCPVREHQLHSYPCPVYEKLCGQTGSGPQEKRGT